ncbi:MAG: hypothetical protein K940chlam1_01052 [Candidatus Anoxychlamydiales bacterium]|nr:hypothetical protein [Candidatus Anoxychlamydiales bacterium]NGX35918.1 hypothetical protein [Candidatus Anoxychlamydiales bacterium]
MSYLFPVNPIDRSSDPKRLSPVEKIGDERDHFSQDQENEYKQEESKIERKVNKLISSNNFAEALEMTDLDIQTKSKLLKIAQDAAATFLKKELLSIAKSVLSLSLNPVEKDDIDEEDLTLSDQLARLVMKIADNKASSKVKNKVGMANPLEDKNAGYLVHYCKDILNQKIKQHKMSSFKSQRLNKNDLKKFLKK